VLLTVPAMMFKVAFTAADAPELFYWLQGESLEAFDQLPLVLTARALFGVMALYLVLLLVKGRGSRNARLNKPGRKSSITYLNALTAKRIPRGNSLPPNSLSHHTDSCT
jgi:GPI ethanolamine phosphate transferase membrane region